MQEQSLATCVPQSQQSQAVWQAQVQLQLAALCATVDSQVQQLQFELIIKTP